MGTAAAPPHRRPLSGAYANMHSVDDPRALAHDLIELGRTGSPWPAPLVIDLTRTPTAAVVALVRVLADSHSMLFHGSTFPTVIARLEPRHANDAAKPSGNQTAVYATADASTALAHAILNRNYLTRRLTSYVFGQTTLLGMTIFRATTNLHQLFVAGDDNLYTDGYVYVLTKGHFSRAADRPTEFHSLTAEAPIAALKVSRTLSEVLFVVRQDATRDTVLEYPAHEIPRLAAHARQMQARGPQH